MTEPEKPVKLRSRTDPPTVIVDEPVLILNDTVLVSVGLPAVMVAVPLWATLTVGVPVIVMEVAVAVFHIVPDPVRVIVPLVPNAIARVLLLDEENAAVVRL